ncbi:MAG: hypothetical protein WCD12_20135 [Candidatus Binatus sp.]|uniref:hypothetical protein n=1 Tax=Candidatus Binatus sp. TaxID=2811406 RepID=UPI003C7644C8
MAGSSFTFPLSATGFSTTPTYTASCSIPAGSCTINGTMLVVTTTARNAAAVLRVAAWFGPLSVAGNARDDGDPAGGAGSATKGVAIVLVGALMLAMLAKMTLKSRASARRFLSAIRLRELAPALATLVAFAGLALLVACGGGGGGTTPTGTPAGTYTVTITAMAAAQTATTNVSIIVQ